VPRLVIRLPVLPSTCRVYPAVPFSPVPSLKSSFILPTCRVLTGFCSSERSSTIGPWRQTQWTPRGFPPSPSQSRRHSGVKFTSLRSHHPVQGSFFAKLVPVKMSVWGNKNGPSGAFRQFEIFFGCSQLPPKPPTPQTPPPAPSPDSSSVVLNWSSLRTH